MLITIKEITKETVVKGRNSYGKASVVYDFNGATRTQNVLSFTNPDVFKTLDTLKSGDQVDVTVTKNDQGFNQWAKIEPVSKNVNAPAAASGAPAKASSGTWETHEERAKKQVYIIRQSCLSNAVATLTVNPGKEKLQADDVLSLAEMYEEWVLRDATETFEETVVKAHASVGEVSD